LERIIYIAVFKNCRKKKTKEEELEQGKRGSWRRLGFVIGHGNTYKRNAKTEERKLGK